MPRLIRAAAPARAVSEFVAEITPLSCRRLRASIVLGSSCDINPDVGSNGIDGNIQRRQPSEYDRSLGSAPAPRECYGGCAQSAAHASLPAGGGRSAAIRRNRAWNSSFVARSNSLYKIYLMIAFVSSHGHRGLLATEDRRRRLAEAGVPANAALAAKPARCFRRQGQGRRCANGEGWNYSEREERGVSFREGNAA